MVLFCALRPRHFANYRNKIYVGCDIPVVLLEVPMACNQSRRQEQMLRLLHTPIAWREFTRLYPFRPKYPTEINDSCELPRLGNKRAYSPSAVHTTPSNTSLLADRTTAMPCAGCTCSGVDRGNEQPPRTRRDGGNIEESAGGASLCVGQWLCAVQSSRRRNRGLV